MPTTYSYLEAGTPIIWAASGGDRTITLTSLAANSAREGQKSPSIIHATKGLPEYLEILFESAPSETTRNGATIRLYICQSDSPTAGTNNPDNLTGTDALLSSTQIEGLAQLDFVGALYFPATSAQQRQRFLFRPTNPYFIPVVYNVLRNASGTAIPLSAVASNHRIVFTPLYRVAQ